MKKKIDILQIIVACVLIVSLALTLVVLPDKAFSDKENRSLEQMPKFTLENIRTGKFTTDIADYFADQFPLRDAFVAVKAYSELLLGKSENNGVIKSGDTLIAKPFPEDIILKENLNIIAEFKEATDTEVIVAALPRSVDVFSELLPKLYPKEQDKTLWNDFFSHSKSFGLIAPDLYTSLTDSNEYYRTDHHFTTHGAYTAYSILGETLGFSAVEKNYFNIETVTQSFCGTAMRSSGYYLTKKDSIQLYRYPNDNAYSVIADGKASTLYDFSKLQTTDSYAVFLGGNHARVDITNGTDREKLLVIRDSFADSIAPLLALHFNITLLDLRYFHNNVREIVTKENFEKVLIFESITELSTNKNLSYLKIPFKE